MRRRHAWAWFRSSPYIGVLGGLLVAGSARLQGAYPDVEMLDVTLSARPLFEVSPVLGYGSLALLGGLLGLLARAFEDRFVFTD